MKKKTKPEHLDQDELLSVSHLKQILLAVESSIDSFSASTGIYDNSVERRNSIPRKYIYSMAKELINMRTANNPEHFQNQKK